MENTLNKNSDILHVVRILHPELNSSESLKKWTEAFVLYLTCNGYDFMWKKKQWEQAFSLWINKMEDLLPSTSVLISS